jgi:S-methylmethionine-dependent homocysteine/selenocysteine methylase
MFKEILPSWIELGVKYIGGCCGFVSDDIKELKSAINLL